MAGLLSGQSYMKGRLTAAFCFTELLVQLLNSNTMTGLPKLVVTDIDGVWTDGGMYYTESGDEFKRFNTYDSAGVVFCRLLGIPVAIITGEPSMAVKRRAEKLKIGYCFTGVTDKLGVLEGLCQDLNISLGDVAYIGDDLNDMGVLPRVGYSACPCGAPDYVKQMVNVVLTKKGGEGVFREFVEGILERNGVLKRLLDEYYRK
jgi:YrbI family 3-deoxy-D-manno-octulosonate 8-phosphate phosphatase